MKRIFICLLILLLLLPISSCTEKADDNSLYDVNGGIILSSEIEKVEMGMTFNELVEAIGKAHDDPSSGIISARYLLYNGTELHITFTPFVTDTSSLEQGDRCFASGYMMFDSHGNCFRECTVPYEQLTEASKGNLDNLNDYAEFMVWKEKYVPNWGQIACIVAAIAVIIVTVAITVFLLRRRKRARVAESRTSELE